MFIFVELFIFIDDVSLKYVSLFTKPMFLSGGQFLMVIYLALLMPILLNKSEAS